MVCRWFLVVVLTTFGLYTTLSLFSRRPTALCVGTFPGRWPCPSMFTMFQYIFGVRLVVVVVIVIVLVKVVVLVVVVVVVE